MWRASTSRWRTSSAGKLMAWPRWCSGEVFPLHFFTYTIPHLSGTNLLLFHSVHSWSQTNKCNKQRRATKNRFNTTVLGTYHYSRPQTLILARTPSPGAQPQVREQGEWQVHQGLPARDCQVRILHIIYINNISWKILDTICAWNILVRYLHQFPHPRQVSQLIKTFFNSALDNIPVSTFEWSLSLWGRPLFTNVYISNNKLLHTTIVEFLMTVSNNATV